MDEAGKRADGSRPVTTLQLLALGINGIVGVGIFFVPATVAASAPGLASVVVFAATGLALVPAALTFAVLGRRFDEDGGPVVFARAAFGDGVSFLVGWVAYTSAVLSSAAVIVGLTGALAPSLGVYGPVAQRVTASLLVTVFAAVVATGISISAKAWTGLTVLKLVPLIALVVLFLLSRGGLPAPSLGSPTTSWLRAGLTVTFAYQGFEIVPVIAGQVRSSERSVPVATVGSLLFAIALYVALVWAFVTATAGISEVSAPLVVTAGVIGGAALAGTVAAGTSVSALGISFGMMVTTPRYLSSLAAGGRELFGLEGMTARGVPWRALVVTWALVTMMVNLGELGELFALSSMAVLMQFGVTSAALVALAFKRERGLRPLDAWPAVPTIALGVVLVIFGATGREALVALGVLVTGAILLLASKKRRSSLA